MIDTYFYPRAARAISSGMREPFDLVGFTPSFLNEASTDDAVTQLDRNYAHGGGWHEFEGFKLVGADTDAPELHYPGDPPTEAVARWVLRDERIILFDHAWVAVVQPDGSFRVSRMD
jgi:hypothetical protein